MALGVQNDRLVTIAVRMADMTGKVIEESPAGGLTYLHGHGDIFPKIEKALEGRFPGEGFFINLLPEEAFGEYDDEAIEMVPLTQLGDPDSIVPGLVFDSLPGMPDDERPWYVTDVAEGMAVLEHNHPYAGMGLQFEIKVLDVQEPDETEIMGNDDVVVPGFLSVSDKLVDEDEDDDQDLDALLGEKQEPDDSPMARMSKPPRIIR